MDTEWAKLIANSNACFLVAGRTVDRKAKLFAVTLRKKHIDLKPVSMMSFHEKFEVDLQNEGKKFITMLSKIGVYDVTESDAIYSNKGSL